MRPLLFAALVGSVLALPCRASPLVTDVAPHRWIPGASPVPVAGGADLGNKAELESFIDGVMADQLKWQHLAGATIAIVKDGKLIFAKGYGYADVEKQIPVVADKTLFRPGSVSKLFTWTALMQLVEQGKVDLDADVNTYVAQFKIPATFPQPIRVRNLLTHTGGLEDGGVGLMVKKPEQFEPLAEFLGKHIPARVRPPLTDFNGGDQASYSNWGAALAGLIVSNVSGMSFDDYIGKNIFRPLSMTSSTFREPLPPALAARMSNGYLYVGGAFKKKDFELYHNIAPAGSASSTAVDMAQFMIAQLNDGAYGDTRILKRETAELMHSRRMGLNPYISGSGLGFYENYVNGRRFIAHGGDTELFHSDLELLPEENLGIFVSYNTLPSAQIPMRRSLLQSFMDRYYPAKLPQVKPPEDFKQHAVRYVGSYRFNRHNYKENEKVFDLFSAINVGLTDQNTLRIGYLFSPIVTQWVEVAPSVFRETDSDQMIAFDGDKDGKAQYILNPIGVPFIGAYRISWYEAPPFHYFVLGFGLFCFLGAIYGALRRWKADRAGVGSARWTRRLAATVGVLHVLFVLSFIVAVSALTNGALDWPPSFRAALALPLIAIPLTLALVYFTWRLWRDGAWTRFARIRYSVIALMSVAFLWSLNFWNLLGYKFG